MAKRKKAAQVLDTPARRRLSKKVGTKKLFSFEQIILKDEPVEGEILETPARSRLRKKIGPAELERIETAILRGEL